MKFKTYFFILTLSIYDIDKDYIKLTIFALYISCFELYY